MTKDNEALKVAVTRVRKSGEVTTNREKSVEVIVGKKTAEGLNNVTV